MKLAQELMIQKVMDINAIKKSGSSTGLRAKKSAVAKNRRPPTLANCSSREAFWSITSVHCSGNRISM